nr:ribosome biogenesis GTPase Der [Natranaerofaba carboxydovora]
MFLKPIVALIGRPNVGKSALFNRLVGSSIAVVEDTPGVTRDRIYGEVEWSGKEFVLIDTGGIIEKTDNSIISQVRAQAELAIEEADIIILALDSMTGLTEHDKEIANMLRGTNKPVIMAANKSENINKANYFEFYSLGFSDMIPVSAIHGTNVGDLLDEIINKFPLLEEREEEYEDVVTISLLGKPNVGKSSLVNKILNENRIIVSDEPGTTRDAIDTRIKIEEEEFIFIDTAGLRKKSRVKQGIEKFSVLRSIKALERSDVSLLVIDATQGVTEQDKKIAHLITDRGRGLIILVNKWDLIDKDTKTGDRFLEQLKFELSFVDFAPILFVSAVTGKNLQKLLDVIKVTAENHSKRVSTPDINNIIHQSVLMYPPPSFKGRRLRIYYATQTKVKPPTFLLFINDKELFKNSYRKYLMGRIRENFDFEGTPIHIKEKERERRG